MIYVCGSAKSKYIVESIYGTNETIYTIETNYIQDCAKKILEEDYKCTFILDVENMLDESCEIAECLSKIMRLKNNVDIIIFAIGYSQEMAAIKDLRATGIDKFIIELSQGDQKEKLRKYMNNEQVQTFPELTIQEQYNDLNAEDHKLQKSQTLRPITVSVIGIMPRIGTTTQSMQICKRLEYMGYRVCYIEMNKTGFVKNIIDIYDKNDVKIDEEKGKITFKNLDMFYKKEKISSIYRQGYNFCVLDYGDLSTITPQQENLLSSYLEKDIRFIIGGTNPNEYDELVASMEKVNFIDEIIHYVFSFVDPDEIEDIRKSNQGYQNMTISFADYTPDAIKFKTSQNKFYDELLSVAEINTGAKKNTANPFKKLFGK